MKQRRERPLAPHLVRTQQLMLEGLTNKQIATRLEVTFSTAQGYTRRLSERLGGWTRADIVRHLWDENRRLTGLLDALGVERAA